MLYLNQKDYPDVPYHHNLSNGGAPADRSNIATAGCGLCCMSMIVENMTVGSLPLLECRDLSEELKANMHPGTDLNILGPAVAERYGLTFETSDDREELKNCVCTGGMAVANAGGDREGYTGILSHGGHYVLIVSIKENEACVLDPSWTKDKYHIDGREGSVRESYPFIYVPLDTLAFECSNRHPAYYLFQRK